MRYLLAILGVVLLLGALAGIKWCQLSTLGAAGRKAEQMGPPPEAVGVAAASQQSWEKTLDAIGSVASGRGVSISNEVPGVVTKIAFQSGTRVDRGTILVTLDSSIERAELASAVAAQQLATVTARRARGLVEAGAIAQAELDQAEAELKAAAARVASLRAQIDRKVVRAPFAGRLGIRAIDLGQYLAPGTPITVLETTGAMLVDFTVPQQRLADVSVGMPVRISFDSGAGSPDSGAGSPGRKLVAGSIAAIDPAIDPTTRAVRVRARIAGDGPALQAGMFVDVAVVLPRTAAHVSLPATAIVHAPYGDSVFIVEDKQPDSPGMRQTPDGKPVKVARQQFVRTGPQRGDFVAIVDGVNAGQLVVTAGAFKLRNGSPIFVTDAAVPTPELAPRPENR